MGFFHVLGPFAVRDYWYLPLFPILEKSRVEFTTDWRQLPGETLRDHVDLGVIGNSLVGDAWHPLIDESLADTTVGGTTYWLGPSYLCFLQSAFAAVGKEVKWVTGTHHARPSQRESDPVKCQ